jgi:glycosyltransferase involved in cell wall biosynthesis
VRRRSTLRAATSTAEVARPPAPLEVTVVTPCLDEAGTLVACVREASAAPRLAGATGEVLVADNGSRDGSPAIAETAGTTC